MNTNKDFFSMIPHAILEGEANALDIAVYVALDSFANNKTGEAFPKYETIAKMLKISRPTVIKSVKNLESYGFVEVIREPRRVNKYLLMYRKQKAKEIESMTFTPSVNDVDPISKGDLPLGVNDVDTNYTNNNQTQELKEKVPYQAIVDAYHFILCDLPKTAKLTEERRKSIRARWKENPNLKYWEGIFRDIRDTMPFLMGKVPPGKGHQQFLATLEWIMKEANYLKIIEGKYYQPPTGGEDRFVGVGEWK